MRRARKPRFSAIRCVQHNIVWIVTPTWSHTTHNGCGDVVITIIAVLVVTPPVFLLIPRIVDSHHIPGFIIAPCRQSMPSSTVVYSPLKRKSVVYLLLDLSPTPIPAVGQGYRAIPRNRDTKRIVVQGVCHLLNSRTHIIGVGSTATRCSHGRY